MLITKTEWNNLFEMKSHSQEKEKCKCKRKLFDLVKERNAVQYRNGNSELHLSNSNSKQTKAK